MYEYAVIGAGTAGASLAFELAQDGTVILIEAEARPGYHSTGRSAALFTPNYGNAVMRAARRSFSILQAASLNIPCSRYADC